ncbi:putative Ankyrin repeat domain-containing protein 49 [Hypsibius exemplaris]|uniref:Ankyrin repeat domain-containing protein 49 n=1 Tax=Hypsibius exemplaris TaxID=2072580 RepID=A0A1W0WM42_HYPEX|nr:putative Ankyrin repeat domain-containing protein 49 [Hypsibius exemplaris]
MDLSDDTDLPLEDEDFMHLLEQIKANLAPADEEDDSEEEPEIDPRTIADPQERFLYAAEKNHLDLVRAMLDANPNLIHTRDSPDNYSALHRAAYNNHVEVLRELIRRGGDVNARTLEGRTPLHSACFWNCLDAARVLLENGADINAQSMNGLTPLHLAASRKDARDLVALLLATPGVDPSIQSSAGEYASEIARRSGPFYDLFNGGDCAEMQDAS